MPVPYPIANGQTPDGNKLQADFEYVEAITGAPKTGTLDALVAYAALAPTVPFIGWATDTQQVYFYTGDVTFTSSGNPAGFKVIG